MNISKCKQRRIIRMCFKRVPNKEIAQEVGVRVEDVHSFRSRHHLTISDIAKLKDKGYNSTEYIKAHKQEFYEGYHKSSVICGCCGEPAKEDDLYILPDKKEVHLCDRCIMASEYFQEHGADTA